MFNATATEFGCALPAARVGHGLAFSAGSLGDGRTTLAAPRVAWLDGNRVPVASRHADVKALVAVAAATGVVRGTDVAIADVSVMTTTQTAYPQFQELAPPREVRRRG